jgi:hypothetical protein
MQKINSKDINYSINPDIRTCRKNLRLSEKEERAITEKAAASNMSFNSYVINAALGIEISACRWRSEMLRNLCKLYELAQKVENEQIRQQIMDWGQRQWQYLK